MDRIWTNVYGAESIRNQGAQVPEKEWSGEWWRGNELGYIINTPVFWSENGVWPNSNALGSMPNQHVAIRPFFVEAYGVTDSNREQLQDYLAMSAKTFLKERREAGQLIVQEDLLAWVYQILHNITFDEEISFSDAEQVVPLAQTVTQMGTIGQVFPSFLYPLLLSSTAAEVGAKVDEYEKKVEKKWGANLTNLDCTPSSSCKAQLASGLWDAHYSAGGLSVPQTISAGLGVLYSTSSTNPSVNFTIPAGKVAEFFWECIRSFPPVIGFPHWTKRPTCAGSDEAATEKLDRPEGKTEACDEESDAWISGYPPVNQYSGGERVILDLPSGQWDKDVWGPEADTFHLFSLEDYEKKSVGFAEMAVNDSVAGGMMNRACPARELAIMIGTAFFTEFNQSAWSPSTTEIVLLGARGPVTVSSFTLTPVS